MKKLILFFAVIVVLSSCKKDSSSSNDSSLFVDITADKNTGVASLPAQVTFNAIVPDGEDAVTWDFGDGSTGTGNPVNHTYADYGVYAVTANAKKGSREGSVTKNIPVILYKKFEINKVFVLETEPNAAGGNYWDYAGDPPDLNLRLTFPGNIIYTSNVVLNNRDTGTFNVIPPQGTFALDSAIKVEILDKDTDVTPDYQVMGTISFNIPDQLQAPFNSSDTIDLVKNRTKLRLIATWIP